VSVVTVVCVALLGGGCASTPNMPFNKPLTDLAEAQSARSGTAVRDSMIIGLAFSGGGTRAAAFGYGVLKEIEATTVNLPGRPPSSLYNYLSFVSGVSGGSVLAAYVGLRNREALKDFREKFLLRNAEENLSTRASLINVTRALGGGINEARQLTGWLDDNLYQGATFGDIERRDHPRVYIYASDIYNSEPFVFSRSTFEALCSDYASYPLSQAVAASAAVPFVFSPIVVESFPDRCRGPLPAWVDRAAKREDSAITKAVAQALQRYRDPNIIRYVKLVDGGVTDNFGISGFVVDHEQTETPYAPLTEEQAVRLQRALILVINAGQSPAGNWGKILEGPSGADLARAVTDTMIKSSSRASFDAFRQTFKLWREELVRWRCRLSLAHIQRLRGSLKGWNCRDVHFYVGEVAFDQLGPVRAKTLSAIPTRFRLEPEQVDSLIAAGQDALRANGTFQEFLRGIPRSKAPVGREQLAADSAR
jgi:predicted acylesterase/phospholipase RssA